MIHSLPITVRRLKTPTEPEVRRVVEILTAAFDNDDPWPVIMVGGNKSLIPEKFETNVRAAALDGEIHVATVGPAVEDMVATSIWFGPGKENMGTEEQRAAGWNEFLEKLPSELKTWWSEYVIPTLGKLGDECLGPGFKVGQWHLLLLGVVPEYQGRGIGKTLMEFGEKQAKADGVSVVLETTTELDVNIYKHLGYHVTGQTVLGGPYGECDFHQMMKTP